jgi:hypothetical protein
MTEMYERGLKVRREVLGADYVDKQIASADDFNRPMQNLVTEYCWGSIWNRPGLDRRTRSMLNLAMLSALNRHHEFKAHVKGRDQERRHQAGDHRGAAAGRDLLRRAGRRRALPPGARGVQGGGRCLT